MGRVQASHLKAPVALEVFITPAAAAEFEQAEDWHEPLGWAEAFREAFFGAVEQLEEFPESGRMQRPGQRRVVLHNFPYNAFYELRVENVRIVAISHTSRRPGYWLHR